MSDKLSCCICDRPVKEKEPLVFAISGFGTPRHICTECDCLIDMVAGGREYDDIKAAMETLSERISPFMMEDSLTVDTFNKLLTDAKVRADAIKAGTYDFADDEISEENSEDGFDDIPEELRETEEDRALDEKEAQMNKRFDKIINWIMLFVGVAAAAFLIYWFFFR